jgi:hypothetical protein
MPLPVLPSPLAMIGPTTPAVKLKGSRSLLTSTWGSVENQGNNGIDYRGLGDVKEHGLFWNESTHFS